MFKLVCSYRTAEGREEDKVASRGGAVDDLTKGYKIPSAGPVLHEKYNSIQ